MKAYIHHGQGTNGQFLTEELPVRVNEMPHHKRGLSWTATGYGERIPMIYMVKFNGRWRRVYCAIYSNVGTCYIGRRSDNLIIQVQS